MANLTAKSKKGNYYIYMYNKAKATSLAEFYTRYSAEKGRAEKAIKEEMARYNRNVFAKAQNAMLLITVLYAAIVIHIRQVIA